MQGPYMLDTNICIYIIKHRPGIVRHNFEKHLAARNILRSVITIGELRYGAEKSQHKAQVLKIIKELSSMLQIFDIKE